MSPTSYQTAPPRTDSVPTPGRRSKSGNRQASGSSDTLFPRRKYFLKPSNLLSDGFSYRLSNKLKVAGNGISPGKTHVLCAGSSGADRSVSVATSNERTTRSDRHWLWALADRHRSHRDPIPTPSQHTRRACGKPHATHGPADRLDPAGVDPCVAGSPGRP